MPRLSINIVAWNSMEYLPDLLTSVFQQTFGDFSVCIINNGSTDGVETFLRETYPQVTVMHNAKNIGFSPAHNQGMRSAIDTFPSDALDRHHVLVTNPDIIMAPTFLEKIVAEADRHPEAGSLGGKLLKAFVENLNDETFQETARADLMDSTGLRADRRYCVAERGAGEMDTGKYDEEREVFGISGALVLYRASALVDTKIDDEFFDEDFFAYKEDVDLAWRLRSRGWASRYVPEAVAHHYRGMYGKERMGLFELLRNRQKKSARRSYYSTRNHWCLLMKNLSFTDWLRAWPWIASMEGARFVYVCLFEPRNIGAFFQALSWAPRMWKKRRWIMKHRRVGRKELRRWFV
jgi:GT2 family glycosyltransferase